MAAPCYNVKTYLQAKAQYKLERGPCAICGKLGATSPDHIRAVSDFPPGTPAAVISAPSNLRAVHSTCNSSRGGRLRQAAARAERRTELSPLI